MEPHVAAFVLCHAASGFCAPPFHTQDKCEKTFMAASTFAPSNSLAACPTCETEFRAFPNLAAPYLLSPCGHSLCQVCLEAVQNLQTTHLCPVCATLIASSIVNISLGKYGETVNNDDDPTADEMSGGDTAMSPCPLVADGPFPPSPPPPTYSTETPTPPAHGFAAPTPSSSPSPPQFPSHDIESPARVAARCAAGSQDLLQALGDVETARATLASDRAESLRMVTQTAENLLVAIVQGRDTAMNTIRDTFDAREKHLDALATTLTVACNQLDLAAAQLRVVMATPDPDPVVRQEALTFGLGASPLCFIPRDPGASIILRTDPAVVRDFRRAVADQFHLHKCERGEDGVAQAKTREDAVFRGGDPWTNIRLWTGHLEEVRESPLSTAATLQAIGDAAESTVGANIARCAVAGCVKTLKGMKSHVGLGELRRVLDSVDSDTLMSPKMAQAWFRAMCWLVLLLNRETCTDEDGDDDVPGEIWSRVTPKDSTMTLFKKRQPGTTLLMAHHRTDGMVQTWGSRLLSMLLPEHSAFLPEGWMATNAATTMAFWAHDTEFQIRGCTQLGRWFKCASVAMKTAALDDTLPVVLGAMRKHWSNQDIQVCACDVFTRVMRNVCVPITTAVVNHGGMMTVMDVLKRHRASPAVCLAACKMLSNLFFDGVLHANRAAVKTACYKPFARLCVSTPQTSRSRTRFATCPSEVWLGVMRKEDGSVSPLWNPRSWTSCGLFCANFRIRHNFPVCKSCAHSQLWMLDSCP